MAGFFYGIYMASCVYKVGGMMLFILTLPCCGVRMTRDTVYGAEKTMPIPVASEDMDGVVDYIKDLNRLGPVRVRGRIETEGWVPHGGWIYFEIDF